MGIGTSREMRPVKYDANQGPSALLAVFTVLLLTLTLRAPVTSVAPVVPDIGADHQLGTTALSLLTSLPLVCFVLVAPIVPRLLGRWGMWRLVTIALLAAALGTVLRSIPGAVWLASGTLVLGCAVATASVLAPAVVRQLRPGARTSLTAVYSAGLSLGPAMATGLTIPAAHLLGDSWQLALALWAVLPLRQTLAPHARGRRRHPARSLHHASARTRGMGCHDLSRDQFAALLHQHGMGALHPAGSRPDPAGRRCDRHAHGPDRGTRGLCRPRPDAQPHRCSCHRRRGAAVAGIRG